MDDFKKRFEEELDEMEKRFKEELDEIEKRFKEELNIELRKLEKCQRICFALYMVGIILWLLGVHMTQT